MILGFVKLIPTGSFVFTDRFFTTPRVASYVRDVYNCYITGTLMKSTKGVDKDIQFKKSKTVGRGFFKWSQDTVSKIIQVCWLDRNPVLMLSSMISACVVGGLQRLTYSKESGYKRQDMQCPEMAREYNQEGMGWGDSNDRMKLARRTSCEMNLVSKRWDWRLFWGLMDVAITNAFVLYTFFHKTTTHSQFFFELAFEWFKVAKNGGRELPQKRRLSTRQSSNGDDTVSEECGEEGDAEAVPKTSAAEHQRRRFKGKYKRACYVCLKLRCNVKIGKNVKKETGAERENFPRPNSGCKTCNVALCMEGACWRVFHTQFVGCSQPYNKNYWESSDDQRMSD